ncbi:putative toxin-antitoxin system toxin component, PIN family [Propionivibrio limicola]|uniref:putative toxin-antitoxin system toxin component, PIN family n=1 Tax=Propionivibrio limicola TaxID=167645 RepID=UPI0012926D64|nr:putative toxin-antitoxin system toxin component, PIN family [Propionivibrio limicola]
MHVVLDTNVVMDMLHFDDRHTRPLHDAATKGDISCFTDTECLAELERVTTYPEFKLDEASRAVLMERYRQFVNLCEYTGEEFGDLPRCRDADDQKFLILAARCRADLLITRDKQLLKLARRRGLRPPFGIVTPEAACQLLQLAPENPARRL